MRLIARTLLSASLLSLAVSGGAVSASATYLASPACVNLQGFEQAVTEYLRLHQAWQDGHLEAGLTVHDCASKAATLLFRTSDRIHYESRLAWLDRFSRKAPHAVADLSFRLQHAWESEYLLLFDFMNQSSARNRYISTSTEVAYGLGIITAGTRLLTASRNPLSTVKYFHAFRDLFGASALLAVGHSSSRLVANRLYTAVPAPPAYLLSLGFPARMDFLPTAEEARDLRDALSNGAGLLSTFAGPTIVRAIRAARWAGAAGSIETLGASIVLGWLAAESTEFTIQQWDDYRFRREIGNAAEDVARAIRSGDSHAKLKAFGRLISWASHYEAYQHLELLKALADHQELELRLAGQLGRDSERFQAAMARAESRFKSEVLKSAGKSDFVVDPVVAENAQRDFLARSGLDPKDPSARRVFSAWSRSLPKAFRAANDRIITSYLKAAKSSRSGSGFTDYLERESSSLMNELASGLRRGHVARNIDRMYLQIAAFLHSSGDGFLVTYAEEVVEPKLNRYLAMLGRIQQWKDERS